MDDHAYRTDAADSTAATHWRADRGTLARPRQRADGSMVYDGYAMREGILTYHRNGRTVRELVTPEALQTGAETMRRAPVTLNHPDEIAHGGRVTPENYAALAVGDVGDTVTVEHGVARVEIAVRRADALAAVRAGTHELSAGYGVEIDNTPGTDPVHGPYDLRQVRRVTNHLALVDRARGGSDLSVRADACAVETTTPPAQPAGEYMIKPALARLLVLFGVTARVDSDDAAYEALATVAGARADAAKSDKAALDAMTAARDTEKTRADTAEAKVAVLEAEATKRADAAARADLETLAVALKVDPKPHVTTAALRKALATAHLGGTLRADASDAYIEAVIDLAKTAHKPADAGTTEQRGDTSAFAPDSTTGTATTPRADSQPAKRLGPAALSRLHNQNASAPAADRGDK